MLTGPFKPALFGFHLVGTDWAASELLVVSTADHHGAFYVAHHLMDA